MLLIYRCIIYPRSIDVIDSDAHYVQRGGLALDRLPISEKDASRTCSDSRLKDNKHIFSLAKRIRLSPIGRSGDHKLRP